MKNQKNSQQILQLPAEARTRCGFDNADTLTVNAAEGICIIHKKELTVLELTTVITALSELASDMTAALAKACGFCDHCGQENPTPCADCKDSEVCAQLNGCKDGPAQWVADCSLCQGLLEGSEITVPDYLLEEAGIPKDAKLEAYADEDSGEIVVVEADVQQDISDVPPEIVAILATAGVCLAELDELIMLGEIVYGK